ncbi:MULTISPECIES: aspartyl-phosphate phosphatase Spo0E family protein [Clostridium]|uniref:Aspartyl-phosphate phosphatase Spo0E family protein n=1 Tax=Clostridium cibarium TaxID=2762247 RepID=A0ABR8PZC4_9CLOT|nr:MULTISPECIES: aspartyl-phosphate phosphatase Spo0E family protein [Clostridium]MBD7913508.1 aspartyl-phosphate phosphatase Spo0E family protein [Clostridium cibarium]
MRELKLKNDEAFSKLNQAMEKARANLYKSIEIYGRSSNEVITASKNLDLYINMSMKREF